MTIGVGGEVGLEDLAVAVGIVFLAFHDAAVDVVNQGCRAVQVVVDVVIESRTGGVVEEDDLIYVVSVHE